MRAINGGLLTRIFGRPPRELFDRPLKPIAPSIRVPEEIYRKRYNPSMGAHSEDRPSIELSRVHYIKFSEGYVSFEHGSGAGGSKQAFFKNQEDISIAERILEEAGVRLIRSKKQQPNCIYGVVAHLLPGFEL